MFLVVSHLRNQPLSSVFGKLPSYSKLKSCNQAEDCFPLWPCLTSMWLCAGTDKCVGTRAGRAQAGSKCQHHHAKNAICHAWSPQTKKASLSSRHRIQKCFQYNVTGSSLTRDEHVHIPDVDLREQIYDSATIRQAPNDAESATITFDTGVAQGSITFPQLFNFFINALLRMLTATGQNQGISNGLQIGKN